MLKIDPLIKPTEGNVEHREIYEYGLMDGVISEAGMRAKQRLERTWTDPRLSEA